MNIKDIKVKKKACILNNEEYYKISNIIGLYIVADRKCNANCDFCEFRSGISNINLEKLKNTILKLKEKFDIPIIHITGGEPTLNIEKFKKIVDTIKSIDKTVYISVNTNGINLNELIGINIDNIALSRHAISNEDNFKIFGTNNIATDKDIEKFPKNRLHLSCNLIKGYIDSENKLIDYLNKYGNIGVYDFGFVSLMKVNEYCKKTYVNDKIFNNFKSTRHYKNIDNEELKCECRNYLYTTNQGKLVSFYKRAVIQSNLSETSYLVYENNKLRNGFSGEYIEF